MSRSDWKTAWTTAPEAYDSFGTRTTETGVLHEKPLRQVLVDPMHFEWQLCRYGSGLYGTWEQDPRVEEAHRQAMVDQERVRWEQYAERRQVGLVWLKTADSEKLEATDENHTEWQAHNLDYKDIRVEKDRRQEEKLTQEKKKLWESCAALFPEGADLIDPGTFAKRGTFGMIPGRDPFVWRSVKIVPSWPADDPDRANVTGEGGEVVGSLVMVAERITRGDLRVATPEDTIPPLAVLKRLGHRDVRRILRVEVGGTLYWAGRTVYSEPLALQANGHLVRGRATREEVLRHLLASR
jgi:hypothetical protein